MKNPIPMTRLYPLLIRSDLQQQAFIHTKSETHTHTHTHTTHHTPHTTPFAPPLSPPNPTSQQQNESSPLQTSSANLNGSGFKLIVAGASAIPLAQRSRTTVKAKEKNHTDLLPWLLAGWLAGWLLGWLVVVWSGGCFALLGSGKKAAAAFCFVFERELSSIPHQNCRCCCCCFGCLGRNQPRHRRQTKTSLVCPWRHTEALLFSCCG